MKLRASVVLVQIVALWVCCSAGVGTLDDKLPARVEEITRKQIERYLGTNDFKGVPLLDRTVKWNSFTNWPDQFSFKGRTYRPILTDTSGGDYFRGIKSRADVRPGMQFLANYTTGTNFPPPMSISCVWRGDGSVAERIVDVEGKRVFGHQFFPTGRLYLFMIDDAQTKDYALEYFDGAGRLVGTDKWTGTKQQCEWEGKPIDCDTLRKRSLELYNQFGK